MEYLQQKYEVYSDEDINNLSVLKLLIFAKELFNFRKSENRLKITPLNDLSSMKCNNDNDEQRILPDIPDIPNSTDAYNINTCYPLYKLLTTTDSYSTNNSNNYKTNFIYNTSSSDTIMALNNNINNNMTNDIDIDINIYNQVTISKDKFGYTYINDYLVEKIIGKGSNGIIYLANKSGNKYAIKEIINILDFNTINILYQLNHINIIKIHHILTYNKYLYIIMEYFYNDYKNIKTYQDIISILYQVARGIHWLHKHKIIHRDIKYNNILYNDGIAKIIDLDSHLFMNNKNIKTNKCCTPLYTAPEIINNEECTKAIDCWSFGILMYYMLYNTYPFNGQSVKDLYYNITNNNIIFPEFASDNDKYIITQLLEKKYVKRMTINSFINNEYILSNINDFTKNLYINSEVSFTNM